MCGESYNSSYSVVGIAGQYDYSLTWPNAKACKCDNIQEEQFHRREYFVSATWAQSAPIVITRSGPDPNGRCCYYGTGDAQVTVQLRVVDYRYCCNTGVETLVNDTTTSRTTEVPICLSLICDQFLDAPCTNMADRRMTLNICICGFALDGNFSLCTATGADFGCEELQCEDRGLYAHGICYEHAFPLKPPHTVLSTERIVNTLCFSHPPCQYYGTTPPSEQDGCMVEEHDSTQVNGPFAISVVEPFTIGIDEPADCSLAHNPNIAEFSAVHALTACGDTPTLHCAPCWNASKETDCCEAIVGGGPQSPYPTFI
jgi:hypothetical protein